jgi:hypothetical protein
VLEKDFAKQVESIFNVFGWKWKHDLPAQRQSGRWATALSGSKGFPDYIAVRGQRIICAELKASNGRLTEHQKEWIELLEATGKVEVYVWRPDDLEKIAKILSNAL